MKFSVVIPVYKVEAYLDQCVESVLTQTYPHLEVILVDDGSPDRCGSMCDEWAAKDDRIRVIHQQNGGLSAARNTGIRHVTGDYVIFLDSDDWWETNAALETVAKYLERIPVDVLTFNYRKSYDGSPESSYFSSHIPSHQSAQRVDALVREHLWICSSWNKVIRSTLFKENALFFREGITSEDMDWSLRLALKAQTFAFLNCCVLVYRQRPQSITASVTKKSVAVLCGNIACCVQLLKEAGEAAQPCLNSYVAYLCATLVYNVAMLPKCDRKEFAAALSEMKYLLDCSDHPKVRMICRCSRFLGLSTTMMLLRWRGKLCKRRPKGG